MPSCQRDSILQSPTSADRVLYPKTIGIDFPHNAYDNTLDRYNVSKIAQQRSKHHKQSVYQPDLYSKDIQYLTSKKPQ